MSLPPALAALLAPPDPTRLPLPPAALPAAGVRLLRGVPYLVPDGRRPLELDLWLPAEPAGPLPVVVFVHGGAWRTGLRDDLGPAFRSWRPGPFARLAQAGFAVACADYRLSGEAVHPTQVDDLTAALSWLHARSGELGLDTARTVVWGESAGGHLAALLALTMPDRDPEVPPVTGCVTWYAPTDLVALTEDPADPRTFEAMLVGGAPADLPERARDAGPVHHVTSAAPPFLVLHGTQDSVVPSDQAVRLAAALRGAGVSVDLHLVPGADHLWHGLTPSGAEDCFTRSLDFVRARTADSASG
ncbi:acetyl esterase/lipase [Streptomyces sp. V3I8]|uniref:alpha/beta hydrolase n=1 Tax=Streptomyces sp. V3I8 TaxID=3042279 RepID=UPI002782558E|nr:alpha/beta hydrolase [Streptomyces sp. V3I8]MDQ1041071.1 acetyl esterase/lipase [Streptomyces sp. V3I8]